MGNNVNADDIRADLDICFSDLPDVITYKSRAEEPTVNVVTGDVTEGFTDISITAIRGMYSAKEVALSGGFLQIGDVFFQIRKADMKDGEDAPVVPKNTDVILDGAERLRVIGFREDTSEMKYKVTCRRHS